MSITSISRRKFVGRMSIGSLACATDWSLPGLIRASGAASDPNGPTRVYLDSRRTLQPMDRNLFGSFLEHLGRAIYGGIYDPGSKLADSDGFRKDVLEEIKRLGVPIIRYPGGNFVSGYRWLDGVGPKKNRPRVLDKAWNTIETNQFGTNEFLAWCRTVGAKPLMGLNLGTGTPEEAAALVEYCNVEKGTRWSELRREHGIATPHKIQDWCLGNEMDGPWQIGHMSAQEYGLKAADAARQMRDVDPSLKLIACGSSGPFMATYLEWDREVLEQCYDYVDGLSLHRYVGNRAENGSQMGRYLASNLSMERQIAETAAVCDYVQGRRRSQKKLWLSFDEWNVWYRTTNGDFVNGKKQEAPHLLEEVYDLADALVVGGIVNSLLRNSDRVKIACLAQLVNVIAPISTNATGLMRHTIFYPYSWGLQYARGSALNLLVDSPVYEGTGTDRIPYVDVAATWDAESKKASVFVLNRDTSKSREIQLLWEDGAPARVETSLTLTGHDLAAVNSFEDPQRVAPQNFAKPALNDRTVKFEVPASSYSVIQWSM